MGKPSESWGRKAIGTKDRNGLLSASCHGAVLCSLAPTLTQGSIWGDWVMSGEIESRISLGDDCYLNLNGAVLVKDGDTKYLTPIEFRLLRYLAEHMGEVVSSNDLIVRGWGENTMAQRDELYVFIRQIRIQLEDNPDEPTCLQTIRRRGYVLYPRQKPAEPCASVSNDVTQIIRER